jgi:RimJ/RimL family protein N-acetyltransferase
MALAPVDSAPRPEVRISLRPATPRDADLLRRWRGEPSIRRYQPLNELTTAQLRSDVAGQRMGDLHKSRGEKFQWIVQVEGEPAGWLTLVVSNWEHGLAEVGYALSSAYQGRGVMTRALALLLADLFAHTALEWIEARCPVGNTASQRLLEKARFTREGRLRAYFRLRGRRVDNPLYAILRGDFYGRHDHDWAAD